MSDVEFNPLGQDAAAGLGPVVDADLTRLTDVTVELTVEVGRTHMSLGETMSLGPGSVVTLDRLADKPVDLLVNGRPIARGEVVVIDEQFGLRITEVVGAEREPVTPVPFTPEVAAAPTAGELGAADLSQAA
jgi:flagellar motor switch protein FliN